MSVKVDLAELGQHLQRHPFAYLLTVGEDLRAHAVAVQPTLEEGGLLLTGLGRRTSGNLAARPDVSLVWPPYEPGGYSLIVDGRATVIDEAARVEPTHAVLHRPADHAAGDPAGSGACGNDCVPLES
ncbi:MAG TPA: pyridoxamine 5'-phosphate oxidase family protein [Nocardioides sp.]|nr:pyridoxamine 5'-phosphate oxidase family protein [Nocardioides sp.]